MKWSAGEATSIEDLGDPLDADDYGICLYAGPTEELVFVATAPAGGTCGGRPCWSPAGSTGFRYKDLEGIPEGSTQMALKSGGNGRAKASWRGAGPHMSDRPLGLPAPPVELPLRAQIHSTNGTCFEAVFNSPSTNEAGVFRGKSD